MSPAIYIPIDSIEFLFATTHPDKASLTKYGLTERRYWGHKGPCSGPRRVKCGPRTGPGEVPGEQGPQEPPPSCASGRAGNASERPCGHLCFVVAGIAPATRHFANAHLIGRFGAAQFGELTVDPISVVSKFYSDAIAWHIGCRCDHLALLSIDDTVAIREGLAGATVKRSIPDAVRHNHVGGTRSKSQQRVRRWERVSARSSTPTPC